MSFSAAPQDDVSLDASGVQPLSSSFKAVSFSGSGTTPRLLFTWDPYGHVAPAGQSAASSPQLPKPSELVETSYDDGGGRQPSSGEESSTPSSMHNANANDTAPVVTSIAAQPPLTISTLLSSMGPGSTSGGGSVGVRSPQLSSNVAVLTPHQKPPGDTGSAHSTPSGPMLKRISTSAKDGRQYFLDYSPTTPANANPAAAMPNLMLPPNLSPHSHGVSPLNSALPQSQPSSYTSQQQQQQLQAEMDLVEVEHRGGSMTTSPQAVPLVSPPRSSSIGGVVGPGCYAYNSLSNYANGGCGTSPQQRPQSSSLPGNSISGGLLSASVSSANTTGVTQHNPYRTSPTFYPVQTGTSASATAAPPSQVNPSAVVQRVQTADTDADLYEVLETTPSLFIKRLLPPPPPLPDVVRVLPTPGVVQSLCERWCSLIETVLRSREFSDITTQPPPPPPIPSSADSSLIGANATTNPPTSGGSEDETADSKQNSSNKKTSSASQAVLESLRTWYAAALEWYEQLDQTGATTVDIRASSRTVAWAIEVAASGRARRGGQGNNSNASSNGRYHGQASGGRGGASNYRGGGAYGCYVSSSPYGGRYGAMGGGYRGGRGTGSIYYYYAAGAGAGTGANGINNNNNSSIRGTANEMEAAENSSGNTRNAFYTSNFNPYAESWTFSGGDAQLTGEEATLSRRRLVPPPPLPSTSSKPSYLAKAPSPGQQGYAANSMMGQM